MMCELKLKWQLAGGLGKNYIVFSIKLEGSGIDSDQEPDVMHSVNNTTWWCAGGPGSFVIVLAFTTQSL